MYAITNKTENAQLVGRRLSWMVVGLWLAGLFPVFFYALQLVTDIDKHSIAKSMLISILMYLIIIGAFYIAGLVTTGVLWRRLPRAKGLLITLSVFFIVNLAISEIGTSVMQPRPNIINHQSAGNLQSTHQVSCIKASSVRNEYSPADLHNGVIDCVNKNEMSDGVYLYAVARAYGIFDTLRVSDRTAHQAISVIAIEAFRPISKVQKQRFSQALKQTFANPDELATLCHQIRQLGPPNYYPAYMIQHGMDSFNSRAGKSPIIVRFDQTSAWERAISTSLHCP